MKKVANNSIDIAGDGEDGAVGRVTEDPLSALPAVVGPHHPDLLRQAALLGGGAAAHRPRAGGRPPATHGIAHGCHYQSRSVMVFSSSRGQ